MRQFCYVLQDELGIHARPAGLLVREAASFRSQITLSIGENQASAKKIFAVMGLCAKQGDEVHITIEGEDEEEAAAALLTFFAANL